MERIRLENFRCYADQSIKFKSGINLLVGDNGSGKTSIIKACKYVLSSFFAGFSNEHTRWEQFKSIDFKSDLYDGSITALKPIKVTFGFDTLLVGGSEPTVRTSTYIASASITIASEQNLFQSSPKKKGVLLSGIKEFKAESARLMTYEDEGGKRTKALPLYAYFDSTNQRSNSIKIDLFKKYYHLPSFGYSDCLTGDNKFNNWIKRLLVLEEGKKNLDDVQIVRAALIDALGENGCNIINDMFVRYNQSKVYYKFIDGREVESEQLSDGYRRVVNFVTDIAFRCALLNRTMFGLSACRETFGTVLIDEIDLHLHPTLQSTILKGLHNAFPNIQFIVTSHAPMVMSSVESNVTNVVYKLGYDSEKGYSINEVVTYGMDLSDISEIILEQPSRNSNTNKKLINLFELIDDNKKEEAWALLNSMKSGAEHHLPDLVEAEALLNFTIIDDETNN